MDVIVNPAQGIVKNFQNLVFTNEHVGVVLNENLRKPNSRFIVPSMYDERCKKYQTTTKVVKLIKKQKNTEEFALYMQIQQPCVNTLEFMGFHIGNYGFVVDKETGRVILIAEGEFQLLATKSGGRESVSVSDENCSITIKKVDSDEFIIINEEPRMEEETPVSQNGEIVPIHKVKLDRFSWRACFRHKYVTKKMSEIEKW